MCACFLLTAIASAQNQSMDEKEKIQRFFTELNTGSMHLVDAFYDQNAHFIDPLIELKSRDDIKRYYRGLYQNVNSVSFEYEEMLSEGKTHVVFWRMTLATNALNGGKPYTVSGVSHITFGGTEGKVIYHRDYYDLSEF
ncbi:MAG: nuclear transport factor 2 family protein, partial [Candidatus Omnitrophica bacterium]|nr:nuclear transport factor 2 family protein [Candidatus Omnitrophota bacterium]